MTDDANSHATAFQVERLAFFSDAVFAIAITLLVLEIKVPELHPAGDERMLWQALLDLLPKVIGFVLSFLVIGTYWITHHRLFRWVRGYDGRLVWKNLRLLLCVSFIPFPTAFFSEYPAYRTSLIFYAVSLVLVGLAQIALWRYLVRHADALLDPAIPPAEAALLNRRGWAVLTVCLLAIALSFLNLTLARFALLLIPVAVWLVTRGLHRQQRLEPAAIAGG
jgi:uncharacterized membrane protein